MITSPEKYGQILESIKNSNDDFAVKMVNPDSEPVFKIDLNTRNITIPKELKTIAVTGDHNAETIYFEVDRYFDNYDLSQLSCVVQYRNALNEEDIMACNVDEYLPNGKIHLGWTITQHVALAKGNVTFAVRFFKLDENKQKLLYSLNTNPVTVSVSEGLEVINSEDFIPPLSDLTALVEDLFKAIGSQSRSYNDLENKPIINGREVANSLTSADLKLVGIDNLISDIHSKSSIAQNGQLYGNMDLLLKDILNSTDIFNPYVRTDNIDSALNNLSTNPVQNKVVYDEFDKANKTFSNINKELSNINDEFEVIREEIGNSVYIPIEIISFSNNIKTVEKGNTVTEITFNYSFNQVPNELVLSFNEEANYPSIESSSFTKTGLELKEDTIFTLIASDKKSHNEIMTSNIEFLNGVYYGSSSEPELYDNVFVLALNKTLQKKHGGSFNTEALDSQYIYYCAPTAYGIPRLSVSGLVGGFEKVQTINFTNSYGYEESYDIYRSEYSNLGSTLVKVE